MKSIATKLILIVLIAVAASSTTAQKASKQNPCANAMTQGEINQCTAEQFRKADKKLNEVYKRILGTLGPSDRTNLIEAQRAWLKYRTANCWANRSLFQGGSIAPTIEATCLEAITDQRIKELIRIYETEGGRE